MACNCTKCNPNKPCGCSDSALNTPCSYTDCSVGSERCAEGYSAECVIYNGVSFEIGTAGQLLKVDSGERLDSILQKMALMIAQGVGVCTSDDLHHAPYNLYAVNITSTGFTVVWNGESTLTTGIDVYVEDVVAATGWTLITQTSVAPTVLKYTVENLAPNTDYKVKLVSTDALLGTCESVILNLKTLTV